MHARASGYCKLPSDAPFDMRMQSIVPPKPMLNAEIVLEEKMKPQRRKKAAMLRKAIWIHTWVLLSWALSNHQIKTEAVAVDAIPEERVAWPSGSEIEHTQEVEVNEERWKDNAQEAKDVIVVATVDGTLAGLSRRTGKTLWKQPGVTNDVTEKDLTTREEHMRPQSSSNEKNKNSSRTRLLSPLLATTTTTKSGDYKTAAVPSVDGRVYLTSRRESSGAPNAVMAESTQVSELVSRSPFVDGHGSFYVGSRQTSAAAIDRDTGEILRVVSGENAAFDDGDLADRNIVWLGRVDNSVSMYDTRTGASDVQFSTAQIMSVQDMLAGTGHQAEQQRREWDENLEHAPPQLDHREVPFQPPPKLSLVIATPNGNVAFCNSETGEIEWVAEECFDTPVAFAVQSSTGESLVVDIVPDTPVPSSSPDYVSHELERQMRALTNHNKDEQPLVGSLSSGQLFAMPLGNRKGSNPYQSLGLPQKYTHAASVSTKQAARHLTRQASGLQPISGKHAQDVSTHYQSDQKNAFKKPCSPSNPAFPGCLLGSVYKQGGGNIYYQHHQPLELESGLKDNGAVMIHYHPEIGYMANEEQVHNILIRNKTSRSFFRIMGSWLPPTMALIFVLSYEFGRRHRERKKANEQNSDQNGSFESGEMVAPGNGDAGRNIGVIQMTDEILGYGGHGTMVYKGTLDGRKVAVKRMLKTYHASADREISLLIESDGHPNVVRYFLKEVRGDFVYLALELCDLSLHDLIGSMNVRRTTDPYSICIAPAVKSTMLQIASGVQHLHSLRIVHRDLKPANILLAVKGSHSAKSAGQEDDDQSVVAKFDRGEYVAKISDMGLGKQLAGQSSFGFSTLGNASLANMPSNGSTMVGAGPGSVGWQAPEVMAVRWHAEVSSGRSDSSAGQDSFAEASPMEVAMSSRTSRSVDIFSLGCIFYSTIIPGSHPFGEWYEREANIMRNKPRTEGLKQISEDAYDLITAMIDRDPKARPTAKQVCCHPFFWTPQQRLSFLCDVSDRLECADGGQPSSESGCLALVGNSLAIERNAAQVVGISWDKDLDPDLVNNVARFRTYDPSSVRDCLRLIRNKHHHYDELSADLKERIGSNPNGLQQYFESRFPRLLMHCYRILREQITPDDPLAAKYMISPGSEHVLGNGKQLIISDAGTNAAPVTRRSHRVALAAPSPECEKDAGSEDGASSLEDYELTESAASAAPSDDVQACRPSCESDEGLPRENEQSPTIDDVTEVTSDDSPVTRPSMIQEPSSASYNPDIQSQNPLSMKEPPELCYVDAPMTQSLSIQKPLEPCDVNGDAIVTLAQAMSIHEPPVAYDDDIIVWEGSTAAKSLGCRGWFRSDDEWMRKTDLSLRKRNSAIVRCADDPKFRTRLCNHWDVSQGTFCPMRRKNKCVFAHGPVELRVKDGKRNRWGKLVDKNGDNANPRHSGGEDTYGAARSIESVRKEEGKWNTIKSGKQQTGKKRGSKTSATS